MTDESKETESKASSFPSFETLARALALGGLIIYAGFSLGYQRFYGALGVTPEDIGVSQTMVLARAVSLIPQSGFAVAFFFLASFFVQRSRLSWIIAIVLVVAFNVVWFIGSFDTVAMVSTLLIMGPPAFALTLPLPAGAKSVSVIIITSFLAAVVGESYYLWNRAALAADEVRAGLPVKPVVSQALGLPELEIHADPARVTWVGAIAQRPAGLFTDPKSPTVSALYLGQSSTTVFVLLDSDDGVQLFRLPVASTVVLASVEETAR